jgi:hypothetical protein
MVNSENEDEGAALREDVINNPKLEPVFLNNRFLELI